MPDDGTLVGTGTFLVDSRRALDKLMRFQLPDASLYILSLVRCAVASGASSVSVRAPEGGGVEVRFDGAPLSRKDLEYPYAALFEEPSRDNQRNRELAISLLSLLRLKPRLLSVRSGRGADRLMLRAQTLGSETVQPADDGQSVTLLRAVLGDGDDASLWSPRHAALVRDHCLLCPIPVEIEGKAYDRTRRPEERVDFDEDGVRGWVAIPYTVQARSDIAACRCGVLVQTVVEALPGVQVTGVINDDGFRLNASQSGIVRDERFEAALRIIQSKGRELLAAAAAEQGRRMSLLGRRLDAPAMLERWKSLMERAAGVQVQGLMGSLREMISGAPEPDGAEEPARSFPDDTRRTLWLRDSAARLLSSCRADPADALRASLWGAPLFLGTDLKPLSLAELQLQLERIGHVPYAADPCPDAGVGFRALWAYSSLELEFARRWFSGQLTDVGPLLAQARKGPADAPSGEASWPKLRAIGVSELLCKETFQGGGVFGEVALSSVRPPGGARIHLFIGGEPSNSFDMAGDLRYLAAAAGTSDPSRAALVAQGAVPRLYSKAANEYSPGSRTGRDGLLKLHLLDFLCWACKEPGGLERHLWISAVGLFGHLSGAWSRTQILEFLESGHTLLVSREPAPEFHLLPVISDEGLPEESLRRIFPDCGLAPGPREGQRFLFRRPRCTGGFSGRCLLEWPALGSLAHLSPWEDGDGSRIETPWGNVRALGCGASSAAALPDEAGAALLLAVLRERGALLDEPGHPWRAFVLDAARHFAAPWPGPDGSAKRRRLPLWHRRALEVLSQLPFFATPGGPGMSLEALGNRLETGAPIVSRLEDEEAPGGPVDLVPARADLPLLKAFWPDARFDRPARPGSASPVEGARASQSLTFDEPMLYEACFSEAGLQCLVGLPRDPVPGVTASVRQGDRALRAVVRALPPPLAGSILVDAAGYRGLVDSPEGLSPEMEKLLAAFYMRLFCGLLDRWPSLDPATDRLDELTLYLLLLLLPPQVPEGPEWAELRRRAKGLRMFSSLDGRRLSLAELEAQARQAGFLRYVVTMPPDPPAVPPGSGTVPAAPVVVLPYPQLTAKALADVPLKKYASAQTRRTQAPASSDRPLEARLSGLFAELRGCRGIDMEGCPPPETVRLVQASAGGMLPEFAAGRWGINSANALVDAVLRSGLTPRDQADYLASLAYTEANRRLANVTDDEDVAFQEALANRLSQDL